MRDKSQCDPVTSLSTHQVYSGAVLEGPRVGCVVHEADDVAVGLGRGQSVAGRQHVRVEHDEVLLLPVHDHAVH